MEKWMSLEIRTARSEDLDGMAQLINRIIAIGGSTAYRTPFDADKIRSEFMPPVFGLCCHAAVEGAGILGFQSLVRSDPDWPGELKLPADWGVIATYVDPSAHGRGVGTQLFRQTAAAARQAGIQHIDATIRKENSGGLAYYSRMGFEDYRSGEETVSKRFSCA